MNNVLEIQNLSRRLGEFALQDVTFAVPGGSVMGFIGENGAGKTTTIKLILNLLKTDSGSVRIFGMDPQKDGAAVKEQIGVVLDGAGFHDMLTPSEISNILRRIYKNWDASLFSRYCDRFELSKGKKIKEFSRGMKVKLSISAALSHHPRLLLLDEATSGLDPIVRDEILELFYDFIQDEEHSILMSSHITSDLEKIADAITFIHKGRILLSGDRDELLETYGNLKCGLSDLSRLERSDVLRVRKNEFGVEALVKDRALAKRKYAGCLVEGVSLEDIMLYYVKGEAL